MFLESAVLYPLVSRFQNDSPVKSSAQENPLVFVHAFLSIAQPTSQQRLPVKEWLYMPLADGVSLQLNRGNPALLTTRSSHPHSLDHGTQGGL